MARILALILVAAAPFAVATFAFHLRSDLIWWLTLPIALALVFCARGDRASTGAVVSYALAVGLATFGLTFVYFYHQVTLLNFSSQLALESLRDSAATVTTLFSRTYILARLALGLLWAGVAAFGVAVTYRWIEVKLRRGIRTRRESVLLALVLGAAAVVYARSGWVAIESYRISDHLLRLRRSSAGPPPPHRPGESVLVLQLESVNATAVFERVGGGFAATTPLPELDRLWREGRGTLFPFFWANSSATNRAIESILCGIDGNLADNSRAVASPAFARCLPKDLTAAGYQTRMYHSTIDTSFYSWDQVLPALGFTDVRAGPAIVKPGARRWGFAYDDCAFYDGVGKILRTQPPGPHFTYLEVSMHHTPFGEARRYPAAWAYPQPATLREKYLNSLREQDHCLGKFWDVVRAMDRTHLHLFILGDHGIPLRTDVDLEDRFSTSLLYVPPAGRSRAARAIVSDQPPAQADLYPTIIDLIYGAPHPRSFAGTLRGGTYAVQDRCATSVNMHGLIAYTRADRRAYYSFDGGRSEILERSAAGEWRARPAAPGFLDFEREFGCP